MPQKESVVRLLLVEDRLEDAEGLISILRNGGIAVRPHRPESLDELHLQLSVHNPDLVLASRSASGISFSDVIDAVDACGKDIPVVATVDAIDESVLFDTLDAGARAVAPRSRPDALQRVVRREFDALENRRALRRLEAALRETERRCDSLIASSRDPIAYVHEGMHIRANDAYLEMFGFDSYEDIEGVPLLDMIAPANAEEFKQLLKRLSKGEPPPKTLQIAAQRAEGGVFDATMEFTQASYEGEPCLQIVFRQRTVDPDVVRELDALRQRDQVTGLFNRKHFLDELELIIAAAAEGRPDQSLLLVQPDNYAVLVGEIGLAHTDEFLTGLAKRLEATIGEHCLLARFSDHGFAALCRDSDHAASVAIAEKIRGAFSSHIVEVGDSSLSITVSIGGVQIGEKIASMQQVLGKAGQCLQSAASLGGNRIEMFDPAARDRAEEDRIRAWVEDIRRALQKDSFVLHYQPVISLHGEQSEVYEAFLRMRHENGELVPPGSFLPVAEEHGLIGDIDRWVCERAIDVLAERHRAGKHTTLFVKISATSLGDGMLARQIGERLRQHGLPGERLVLEMPEAKVFTNLKAAQDFARKVTGHGCRIALEQFGSGLNSFQLLQHFDPMYLKIDRSFMADLSKNPENQRKVREIADEARGSGKITVAEFVQDAGSMTVLFTCGVDYVEGQFLAPSGPDMNYDFSQ